MVLVHNCGERETESLGNSLNLNRVEFSQVFGQFFLLEEGIGHHQGLKEDFLVYQGQNSSF